jgi:hypothetical protein
MDFVTENNKKLRNLLLKENLTQDVKSAPSTSQLITLDKQLLTNFYPEIVDFVKKAVSEKLILTFNQFMEKKVNQEYDSKEKLLFEEIRAQLCVANNKFLKSITNNQDAYSNQNSIFNLKQFIRKFGTDPQLKKIIQINQQVSYDGILNLNTFLFQYQSLFVDEVKKLIESYGILVDEFKAQLKKHKLTKKLKMNLFGKKNLHLVDPKDISETVKSEFTALLNLYKNQLIWLEKLTEKSIASFNLNFKDIENKFFKAESELNKLRWKVNQKVQPSMQNKKLIAALSKLYLLDITNAFLSHKLNFCLVNNIDHPIDLAFFDL